MARPPLELTAEEVEDLLTWHKAWTSTPSIAQKARQLGLSRTGLLDLVARLKGELTTYDREKLKALK